MKQSVLAIACCALFLTSCEEKPPVIVFHPPRSIDTTYVLPAGAIPTGEGHNVLVEEYTGQSCTNCPAAHEALNEMQAAHPGKINVIGLYIYGPIQTKPPAGYKYDLRHTEATVIANDIYGGVSLLPSAGVDRVKVAGTLKLEKTLWQDNILTRLAVPDSINMRIGCSYNATDSMLTVKDTLIYTKPVGYPHNLSLVLVEDHIIDIQDYPSVDPVHPGKDDEYDFTNVFRGMITTAPVGDPIADSLTVKEAGRVVVNVYKYKIKKEYKPENCRVIGFVNSAVTGEYHILQSSQTKVKP